MQTNRPYTPSARPKSEARVFPDAERNVFRYHYQGHTLFADPIALLRQLKLVTSGRLAALIEAANAINPHTPDPSLAPPGPEDARHLHALEARGQLAAAVALALNLPPFDPATGAGCLEEEALEVLRLFLEWQHAKKARGETPSS